MAPRIAFLFASLLLCSHLIDGSVASAGVVTTDCGGVGATGPHGDCIAREHAGNDDDVDDLDGLVQVMKRKVPGRSSAKGLAISQETADTWSDTSGTGCASGKDNNHGYCVTSNGGHCDCGEELNEGWNGEERRECFDGSKWHTWDSCGMVCASTHQRLSGSSDCTLIPPVHCAGHWEAWTDCSEDCGGGTQSRAFEVTTEPDHGGTSCPTSPEEQVCNTNPCPVDCNGAWGQWSACTQPCGGGEQNRSYTITTGSEHGGDACPAPETQDCNAQHCPVDCEGSWGDWGFCSTPCGGGTQTRQYTVTTETSYGGAPCESSPQYMVCNTEECPVDCEGSWLDWVDCSVSCGGGDQSRTYNVTTETNHGGTPCPSSPESQTCNQEECPVDCVGDYSSWGSCSKDCGGGRKVRNYIISQNMEYGGVHCPASTEAEECNTHDCPVDCAGVWPSWGECSEDCGGGEQTRAFNARVLPANGGEACPSDETQACNIQDCPVDCEGTWGTWTGCTDDCGGGTQTRTYLVETETANGGAACPSPESQACNTQPCPVNCRGTWGEWSQCSQACGTGTQDRQQIITRNKAHGGKSCPAAQSQECNTQGCPVDCVGHWGEWDPCSASCQTGTQSRAYVVTTQSAYGGQACGALQQSQTCNTHVCPGSCKCKGGVGNGWFGGANDLCENPDGIRSNCNGKKDKSSCEGQMTDYTFSTDVTMCRWEYD